MVMELEATANPALQWPINGEQESKGILEFSYMIGAISVYTTIRATVEVPK